MVLLFLHARVGSDVVGTVAHVPGIGDVGATVQGGYVAAWAPELTRDEAAQGIGLTLTLTDGSTVQISPEDLRAAADRD